MTQVNDDGTMFEMTDDTESIVVEARSGVKPTEKIKPGINVKMFFLIYCRMQTRWGLQQTYPGCGPYI